MSIAVTSFIALDVIVASLEMRNLQPLLTSLYFQLIAVSTFGTLPMLQNLDFDVYKGNPE